MAAGRKAFSHSRLSTLDDCPRRYRMRYVDGLKEAFQTIEAFVGTMVHEALQWAYMERERSAEPTEDSVVDRYQAAWRERFGPGVKVVQEGREASHYRAEGEEMLRRHHSTTFATDRMETLAVEPRVDLTIGESAYMGYVDRLARDREGTLHVVDYKTSRSMPPSAEAAGLQARGYGVAVMEAHGGDRVGIRYEYLRHARALEETLPRSRSAEVADAIGRRIEAALAAERAGDFPARPGTLCRWCGFRESCDASGFHRPGIASGLAAVELPEDGAPRTPVARATSEAIGSCPRCGGKLLKRSGSRGDMIACERYPDCLHSRR